MTSLRWLRKRHWMDSEFLNNLDDSGNIKFTYEMESEGKIPFLERLTIRKDTGTVNLQIYRKLTRTHFDRSQSLISDSTDRHVQDLHIENALRDCR